MKQPLYLIDSRIRYYLLDWRDANMERFQKKYGRVGLYELNIHQLYALFDFATSKDAGLIREEFLKSKI